MRGTLAVLLAVCLLAGGCPAITFGAVAASLRDPWRPVVEREVSRSQGSQFLWPVSVVRVDTYWNINDI